MICRAGKDPTFNAFPEKGVAALREQLFFLSFAFDE